MKKKYITSVFVGLCLSLQAQIIDISTGVVMVNNSPTQATVGSTDVKWSVKAPGSSTFSSTYVSNGNLDLGNNTVNTTQLAENSCARWITPYINLNPGITYGAMTANPEVVGFFQYKMTFNFSSTCPITDVKLNLNYAGADNIMRGIKINGTYYNLLPQNISYSTLKTINMNISPSDIVANGLNTVIITLENIDYYTGMFICGNLNINGPTVNLVPSITGGTNFCAGAPLTFTGSDGVANANNHLWKVVETNSSGIPVGGSTEWQSPTFSGSPGTYTIPTQANGGPSLECGKYYRVQLAVTNQCVNWQYAEKIIKINCLPNIVFGHMDNNICKGEPMYLLATCNNSSNYTVNWKPTSPAGAAIYNGPPASVITYPNVTTTYLCTITDNVTGCSSTASITANVYNNDPSFNLVPNFSNPSFATVQLTANDLLGYNNPGFYYALSIEELTGPGGTAYYSINPNNSCWWNYPNVETFKGFVSTGTGTYNPPFVGTCTSPGQFLYGHTYRITRGTWNDHCPYKQESQIFIPPASRSENSFIVVQDFNAPDLRDVINSQTTSINNQQVNDLTIYPNPSNGLFTIQLNDGVDMNIEVYDLLGKKIKSFNASGNNITIDLTEFSKGIYLVNILQGTNKITKKVVIE